ncbi:hypothetical protein RRG08_028728 [Elysia crispata]|uniref:Reverse transcriptase RNase H-like domain-containing protein n=1 Tax=Elysia crispata TaxID=231223 RepID=A0AAE1B763_9GAST|nr:hypothetical protein RRG08_028728 [Elysia crispata]
MSCGRCHHAQFPPPSPGATISLTSDASDRAVGAVLEQHVNNSLQPLAFFSKQLGRPERKYSTTGKRLLELYLAVRPFRFFLEGRSFTVLTDHKPLVGAMSKVSYSWTARHQTYLWKGRIIANCLSLVAPTNDVVLGIDCGAIDHLEPAHVD